MKEGLKMNEDIFCKIINEDIPSFTCYEDDVVNCSMDASPESVGHTLILPKNHYTDILEIDEEVYTHIHTIAKTLINKMMATLPGISGVVTLINYGKPQTVKHFHMHLIPTYDNKCSLTQEEVCEMLKRA